MELTQLNLHNFLNRIPNTDERAKGERKRVYKVLLLLSIITLSPIERYTKGFERVFILSSFRSPLGILSDPERVILFNDFNCLYLVFSLSFRFPFRIGKLGKGELK